MERRKIQLIAGSTYTVSLPKEWIQKNHLKEKHEVTILEKGDRTLVISPDSIKENSINEISLNIDDYIDNIDQALFAIYYIGAENISLFSKGEISKDIRLKIRKTVGNMSGTEISYEDRQKITIKVMLDKSKIEINQVIYRICLIIELSITSLLENTDIEEMVINENEVDRLYHLISKIVSLSLINSDVLNSSNVKNVTLIPSYFLISKKLENINDNIYYISTLANRSFDHKKEVLGFIKSEINRIGRYVSGDFSKSFDKTKRPETQKIHNSIYKIKDKVIGDYLKEIIRYIIDVQEEVFIISFYKKMIKEKSV